MAVFSTNQNRHLFVVDASKNRSLEVKKLANEKQFCLVYSKDSVPLIRTDLIDVDKVCYAKLTTADKQKRGLNTAIIAIDEQALIDGKAILGQDYIVNIIIKNYCAPGEDSTLVKTAGVHVTSKTQELVEFYEALAKSLELNFSREAAPILKFTANETGVTVEEVPQKWVQGLAKQSPVNFMIYGSTVIKSGEDILWVDEEKAKVKPSTSKKLPNSKNIADLEWFCLGERGDQYRLYSYPNYIPSDYVVDPEDANGYDVIDLHYSFTDTGVNDYKSEKEITFVAKAGGGAAIKTALEGAGITFVTES